MAKKKKLRAQVARLRVLVGAQLLHAQVERLVREALVREVAMRREDEVVLVAEVERLRAQLEVIENLAEQESSAVDDAQVGKGKL